MSKDPWELAEEADARPQAKRAAGSIAYRYKIGGLCDPAYIANILEAELQRFEQDPDSPIIERRWKGKDTLTDFGYDDFMDWADDAKARGAAKATAIRLVRSYPSTVAPKYTAAQNRKVIVDIAELIEKELTTPPLKDPFKLILVEDALEKINKHRKAMRRAPLDPVAAGWTDEDILLEATRLKREGLVENHRERNKLKRRLMR